MQFREALFPAGATRRDWLLDAALAATLIAAQLASPQVLGAPYYPATRWELAVCVAMLAALVFRRHSPLLTFGLVTAFGIAHLATLNRPTFALVAVPFVAYAVARWVPGLVTRLVLVVGAVASLAGPYRWFWDRRGYLGRFRDAGPEGLQNGVLLFTFACLCFGAVATPYIVGRRVQDAANAAARDAEAERQRYAMAAVEREQQARLDEASTRAQIARELHDVVAHSLSIMIVQAEGGRARARTTPGSADETLATIAEVGRDSLQEMRRIVGVLRGTPTADFAPAPRLADVPELVQRTSDRATLEVKGTPSALPTALELTVYRIVQEALTNVLKHAGPDADARVTLDHTGPGLTVEVVDNGVGGATAGAGNGLRGMRERVTAMGGRLTAGPLPGGAGFRVHAWLPTPLPRVHSGISPS